MAFSRDDLDRLDAAIATGTLRVRYRDGRETQFRSLAEMLTTRTLMRSELGISKVRNPVMLAERIR